MRRKDKELDNNKALEIIDNALFASLSVVDLEGLPYVVNLNMVRVDNKLYFHSAMKGFKCDIFKEHKDVCISFVDKVKILESAYSTSYASSIVRGKISLVEDYDEKYLALKELTNKFCKAYMDKFDECALSGIPHTAIYRVDITSITAKGNDLDE